MLQTRSGDQEKFIDPSNGMELWFDVEYFVDVLPDGARQLSRKIQYTSGSKEDISKKTKKMLDIYVEKTQKEPEKMAIFEFNKKTEKIDVTHIYSKKNPLNIKEMTKKQETKLKNFYNRLKNSYTERYLKMAWSEMMYDLHAIPYCGNAGNIWFVPKAGKSAIDAFGAVYRTVHEIEENIYTWRLIPVIDTEAQRKHLKADAEQAIIKRYEHYLDRLGKRVQKVRTQEDLDTLRDDAAEKTEKFEREMDSMLIQEYNKILRTSINIKTKNVAERQQTHMTSRMKRALKFLETGK